MNVFALKQYIAQVSGAIVDLDRCILSRNDRYIFAYHRVLTRQQAAIEGVHHSLWVSPEEFERQIIWMKRLGEIVDYSQITDDERVRSKPLFSVTFDDGWKDIYNHAMPILKQYQVPALIFLATDAIENDALFWPQDIATKTHSLLVKGLADQVFDALYECWPERNNIVKPINTAISDSLECWIEDLKMLPEVKRNHRICDYYRHLKLSSEPLNGYILSWDDVRDMQKYDISFGSHTHHHTILEGLSNDAIETELIQSREIISDKTQIVTDSFCYPNGRYGGTEATILNRCGYNYGFCLDNMSLRDFTNKYYIPRFLISERKCTNVAYFKMCLLEAFLYKSKPHKKLR